MIGRSETARTACRRRAELVDIAERLEDEAVDAAGQQSLHLTRKGVARLRHGHLAERLDAHAERPDRADHGRAGAGGLAREGRGCGVDPLGLGGEPIRRASLTGFAPKVLVSMSSAPACTYSRWMSRTRSGCLRFSSS